MHLYKQQANLDRYVILKGLRGIMELFYALPEKLHPRFSFLEEGQKIPYGLALSASDSNSSYRLKNSYIKINGEVYCLAKGDGSYLGRGSLGKVKLACHLSSQQRVAIKICEATQGENQENSILMDLGLGLGSAKRQHSDKSYTVIKYLGQSLKQYLLNNKKNLNLERRVDLAIKVCWQLHLMHSGLLSKRGIAYAHRDIKPANFTIDNQGAIHLIDVGNTHKSPKKKSEQLLGSPAYMALLKHFSSHDTLLTGIQHDMLALKRTLYFPNSLYIPCVGFKKDNAYRHHNIPYLLPYKFLKERGLLTHIYTGATEGKAEDKADSNLSAIKLAALLVLARYQINPRYFQTILTNENYAYLTLGLYFSFNKETPKQCKKNILFYLSSLTGSSKFSKTKILINNEKNRSSIINLVKYGLDENLEQALNNEMLLTLIQSNKNKRLKRAAIYLFKQGLANKTNLKKLLFNPSLSRFIINFYLTEQQSHIQLIMENPTALKALIRLSQCKEEKNFCYISQKETLLNWIANAPSASIIKLIIALENHFINAKPYYENLFTTKGSLAIEKEKIAAVLYLHKNHALDLLDKALISNNYLLINQIERLEQSSVTISLKKSLLQKFNSLTENDFYAELFKNALSDSELYLFSRLFLMDFNQPIYLSELLHDDEKVVLLLEILNANCYQEENIITLLTNQDAYQLFKRDFYNGASHEYINQQLTKGEFQIEQIPTALPPIKTTPHSVFFKSPSHISEKIEEPDGFLPRLT